MRNRLTRVLPKGMEISHFSVLNNLAWHDGEKTPAQLAETFNVTRGAMTNTLNNNVADELGEEQVRATLETLRALRRHAES